MDLGPLFVKRSPLIDKEELCVRINRLIKPDTIDWYDYVHIRTKRGKITCKLKGQDIPEITPHVHHIYLNEHLRTILGVQVDDLEKIDIEKADKWLMPYYFVRYHPSDIVKVSTWLGVVAIGLGLLSIIIAFVS
jgi:hypothetical protein